MGERQIDKWMNGQIWDKRHKQFKIRLTELIRVQLQYQLPISPLTTGTQERRKTSQSTCWNTNHIISILKEHFILHNTKWSNSLMSKNISWKRTDSHNVCICERKGGREGQKERELSTTNMRQKERETLCKAETMSSKYGTHRIIIQQWLPAQLCNR